MFLSRFLSIGAIILLFLSPVTYSQGNDINFPEVVKNKLVLIDGKDPDKADIAENELLILAKAKPEIIGKLLINVVEQMDNGDLKSRRVALRILGLIKHIPAMQTIAFLAAHDTNNGIKEQAKESLFLLGKENILELYKLSEDSSIGIREKFQEWLKEAIRSMANIALEQEDFLPFPAKEKIEPKSYKTYLVNAFPDTAISIFTNVLEDQKADESKKISALLWLSLLPSEKLLPVVIAATTKTIKGHKTHRTLLSIIIALTKGKAKEYKPILSDYVLAHARAFIEISKINYSKKETSLLQLVQGDEAVIYDFASVFGDILLPELKKTWTSTKNKNIKTRILIALIYIKSEDARKLLAEFIKKEQSIGIRMLIIKAFEELKSYKSTKELVFAMHDHPYIASRALQALAKVTLLADRNKFQQLLSKPYEDLSDEQRAAIIKDIDEWWKNNYKSYVE